MTARVVTLAGRVYVEAPLADFQNAGYFLAFRGAINAVRMGATNPDDARRSADFINQRQRDRDAAALNRSRA